MVSRSNSSNALDVLEKARRTLDDSYTPTSAEDYMNARQLQYFRDLLQEWKRSIIMAAKDTLRQLQTEQIREADLNDRASNETDWGLELRTRDRQRKLVSKIEAAIRRIDEGEYGYCVVTGEPIGIDRLLARPIATMTVEAQAAHERREKLSRGE